MLLSIVIPVYNVEQFIARCLDSVTHQIGTNLSYEVIIVNDGTKDNSMSIVDSFNWGNVSHIIINQTNQGLSVARNTGLLHASGDYVWFVDSDDWIEKNSVNIVHNLINKQTDIIQISYRLSYDDFSLNKDVRLPDFKIPKSGRDVVQNSEYPTPAQFSIFRREFLVKHNLHFCEGLLHEDAEFKLRATYLASTIVSTNEVCYNYYQRPNGSIMSSFRLKNGLDIIQVVDNLCHFANNIPEEDRVYIYNKSIMYFHMLTARYMDLSRDDRRTILNSLDVNKSISLCFQKTTNRLYMIEGVIYRICKRLYFYLYNIYSKKI